MTVPWRVLSFIPVRPKLRPCQLQVFVTSALWSALQITYANNVKIIGKLMFVHVSTYSITEWRSDACAVLPSNICAYCGKPAALSQRHASRASISVTHQTTTTSLSEPTLRHTTALRTNSAARVISDTRVSSAFSLQHAANSMRTLKVYNSKIKRQVNKAWQIRALYESSTPRPQVEV